MAINEKRSYTEVDVTQPTSDFDIGFKFYEERDGINSTVNGVPAAEAGYTTQLVNNNTLRFTPTILAGAVVRIMRETNIDRNVYQFSSGALWTAEQMDENFEQIRHSQQESRDTAVETRRQFDRLDTQVQTVVGGLNEALTVAEQAANAAEGAAEAADAAAKAAADAAELTRSAENVIDSSGKTQQWFNDKIKRENVSVWDFFTNEELAAYKASYKNYDAAPNIQAFFDYIKVNDVGTAYCAGNFYVKSPLLLGGSGGIATKLIVGFFKITYSNVSTPVDTLLTVQTGSGITWQGWIDVNCNSANALNYANRVVKTGVLLGGDYANTHFTIDGIFVENGAKEFGLLIGNTCTGSNIRKIRSSRCGCGYSVSGYTASLFSAFNLESTNSGTTNQYSIVSVDLTPDVSSNIPMYAYIDNQIYFVLSRPDVEGANKFKLFPRLPDGITTGQIRWVFGGGTYVTGSDTSVINIGNVNSSTCSVSLHLAALYPPTITSLTTQSNFCGLILGSTLTQGFVGGSLGEIYCEALTYHVIQNIRVKVSFPIFNNVALKWDRCLNLANWRLSSGNLTDNYALGVNAYNSTDFVPSQNVYTATSIDIDMSDFKTVLVSKGGESGNRTVNITYDSGVALSLFRNSVKTLLVQSPTGVFNGNVTFNAPSGVTLNGSSSTLTYSGVTNFALVAYDSTNLLVVPLNPVKSASVTYDPPSLAPNKIEYWNVTLTGVKLGDMIACSFSRALNGTHIWAECTGANIVTVYHQNPTAATVDIASGTLNVKVI